MAEPQRSSIGVDVGGTSIRAGIVDLTAGQLTSSVLSAPTPADGTVESVAKGVLELVDDLDHPGTLGCALPGVVSADTLLRAPNLHSQWGRPGALRKFEERVRRQTVVLNDADAVGLAEVRFTGEAAPGGLSIILTFGTGIGSAVLHGTHLIESTELGELEGPNGTFEDVASAAKIQQLELSPEEWAARAQPYFTQLERLLSPSKWIIAGGLSTTFGEHFSLIETDVPIRVAHLGPHAGVVGAAVAAAERSRQNAVELRAAP